MGVIWDLKEGTSSYTDDRDGRKAVRTALVDGVAGNAGARPYAAVQMLGAKLGDRHPVIPDLEILSINAEAIDTTKVRVTINYGEPVTNGYTVEIFSSSQEVETNLDLDGNLLFVEYKKKRGGTQSFHNGTWSYVGGQAETAPPQGGKVTIPIILTGVRVKRVEKEAPFAKILEYAGSVNGGKFWGDAEGRWLCSSYTGDSSDNGKTWNVTIELLRNPAGHDPLIVYIDPETGAPPPDLVKDVGYKQPPTIVRRDFGNLKLPNLFAAGTAAGGAVGYTWISRGA